MKTLLGWSLFGLLLQPLAVQAADYYLGSSAAAQKGEAVRDIAALNALSLQPGDRVFFQSDEIFAGTIELNEEDAGTPSQPVVISTFGPGRATIHGGSNSAIKIYNAAGFAVSRLDLVGSDKATSTGSGIEAGAYLPTSTRLPFLSFDQMKISGFKHGVEIWAWFSTTTRAWPGFNDVKLTNLEVFDNRGDGIKTWGTWRADGDGTGFSHADVVVAHCTVWGNRGDPASKSHTGSGITLSGVDRGVVEYCVAHDNGGLGPTTGGGPFGIWTWESRAVTLQYNLVYNQKSSSGLDGGAYDLDGGSSSCVVQYNYSYNNEGPAIGIIQFSNASPLVNSVVRYNISENDCRKNTQGVVYIGDFSEPYGINGADIYGNTFFISTNPRGGKPPVVSVQNHDDIANVRFRNNLFIATHNNFLVTGLTTAPAKALFQGNNYWGGVMDLAKFRAGGQEMLNGGATGFRVDPQLTNPGQGGSPTDAAQLPAISAYLLKSSSPLVGQGLDLARLFGVEPGPTDFYGVPVSTNTLDLGASAAFRVSTVPAPVVTPPPPAPVPATVIVDDHFNGSGSIASRLPDTTALDGGRWTIHTGTGVVSGGNAGTVISFRAVLETDAADCTIDTAVILTTNASGLALRSSDSANYLRLQLTTSGVHLLKSAERKITGIGSIAKPLTLGQTYPLRVTLSGPTITVSIDGAVVGTFNTAFNQTATRHGLHSNGAGGRKWERFTVTR